MKQVAISLGLSLALLAARVYAQQVEAGARALVASEALPVYAAMSESDGPKATLKRGDRVIIGMVLFGSETTWCAISQVGETKRFGYVSCEFLEPERTSAPAPTPAPPPKSPRKTAPIRIAEVPAAPIVVHELTPAPIAPPPPATAPGPLDPHAPAAPAPNPVSPDAEKARNDFAEAALDALGFRAELASYTQNTRVAAFLDKGRLAEIDAATLDRVLGAEFQSGVFLKAIGGQMRKAYSPERMAALAGWTDSQAAHKLAGLVERANSSTSRQALVEFADTLTKTPPAEARLLLMHRIYDATRTSDMEVETTIALVYTAAQAIGPTLPAKKRYSADELDRALGEVKAAYRSVMKNARIVQYLFAWRTVGDAELEQYAGFLESDSGQALISAVDKGFFEATEAISQRLREEILRRVRPRR